MSRSLSQEDEDVFTSVFGKSSRSVNWDDVINTVRKSEYSRSHIRSLFSLKFGDDTSIMEDFDKRTITVFSSKDFNLPESLFEI